MNTKLIVLGKQFNVQKSARLSRRWVNTLLGGGRGGGRGEGGGEGIAIDTYRLWYAFCGWSLRDIKLKR